MNTQIDNFPNYTNQYRAAIAANLIFMSHGAMLGWMSPSTPILTSNSTPLKTGPLTNEQLSWLGSMNNIGAILSAITFGFITLFLGIKQTINLLCIPSILFYILIYFGDTYYHILIARFLTGVNGGGIQTTVIIFITEIASNEIRGSLGSISHLSRNVGVLMAYVLGAIIPYDVVPCIFIIIPIVFAAWFTLLPNTPNYHLKKGDVQKAENALRFYKNAENCNDSEKAHFEAEFERIKTLANNQKNEEKTQLKDIFNRSALMGILNGSILAALGQSTGYMVFTTYAVVIFKEAGATNINPHISAISMGVLQLIGNFCTATLSDSLGRKTLLIASLLGSALGMFTLCLYCYLRSSGYDVLAFEWIPVVSLSFVIFFASAGVVPLMYLGMVEHMPHKIRTVGVTICNVNMNLVGFGILKVFPVLMESIGLYAAVGILSILCMLGSIYVYLAIKETKGQSLDVETQQNCSTQQPEINKNKTNNNITFSIMSAEPKNVFRLHFVR